MLKPTMNAARLDWEMRLATAIADANECDEGDAQGMMMVHPEWVDAGWEAGETPDETAARF